MNKEELLKKVEAAIDAAMRGRIHGKLEIEFVDGAAMFIRESKQEKLMTGTRNRDHYEPRQG